MLFCLLGLQLGCTSNPPKIVTVHDTVEIYRDKYITPPEELLRPVTVVRLPDPVTTIDLKVGFLEQREATKLCNSQLTEISKLGDQDEQ